MPTFKLIGTVRCGKFFIIPFWHTYISVRALFASASALLSIQASRQSIPFSIPVLWACVYSLIKTSLFVCMELDVDKIVG